jgi:hypothetical protein
LMSSWPHCLFFVVIISHWPFSSKRIHLAFVPFLFPCGIHILSIIPSSTTYYPSYPLFLPLSICTNHWLLRLNNSTSRCLMHIHH